MNLLSAFFSLASAAAALSEAEVRDEHDSFSWAADVLCRLVEFFGAKGTRAAGRFPHGV